MRQHGGQQLTAARAARPVLWQLTVATFSAVAADGSRVVVGRLALFGEGGWVIEKEAVTLTLKPWARSFLRVLIRLRRLEGGVL